MVRYKQYITEVPGMPMAEGESIKPPESSQRRGEAPVQAPTKPAIRSQESVLTPDHVGDVRELFKEAADRQQADMREAFDNKDAATYDAARARTLEFDAIARGEAISSNRPNTEPYSELAAGYLAREGVPQFEVAEIARQGLTPELIQAELTNARAVLTMHRIMLHGMLQEDRTNAPGYQEQIKGDLQLIAELEHVAAGGGMHEAPAARQALEAAIKAGNARNIEESRKKVARMKRI